MVNRVRLSPEVWALRVHDGILVGKGTQASHRLKSGPALFDLWTTMRALLSTGGLRTEELIHQLSSRFPVGISRDIIPQLLRVGLLLPDLEPETGAPPAPALREHPLWSYFERHSQTPATHLSRLLDLRLGVVAEGPLLAALQDALEKNGLRGPRVLPLDGQGPPTPEQVAELAADSTLVVALAATPLRRLQLFPVINQVQLKARRPWLSGHLQSDELVLGPLFIPGETACFQCLELREENHLPNPQEYRELRSRIHELPASPGVGPASSAAALLAQAVTLELIRYGSEIAIPTTYRTLIHMDLLSFETSRHALLKVPLCDACGPHVDRPFRRAWSL